MKIQPSAVDDIDTARQKYRRNSLVGGRDMTFNVVDYCVRVNVVPKRANDGLSPPILGIRP